MKSKDTIVIKVGQLSPDETELVSIGAWVFDRPVWDQLHRIFSKPVDSKTPYSVWLDLADMNGDLLDDDPLIIPYYHGQWMLKDWMKPPVRDWKKIKVPPEAANATPG